MSRNIRQLALASLIVLTISIAALGAHVASHANGDQQACEFCSGQGNPTHAIPPSNVRAAPAPQTYFACAPLLVVDLLGVRSHAQQRAPPATT